jgi:hypothetical protein
MAYAESNEFFIMKNIRLRVSDRRVRDAPEKDQSDCSDTTPARLENWTKLSMASN